MIPSALPLTPSPVPLAPLPAATPPEAVASPAAAPVVSSFDAMLAAIAPADVATVPPLLPPAAATADANADEDKAPDAPADSVQPDAMPAVLAALVAPAPPPPLPPSASVPPSPPASGTVLAAGAPPGPAPAVETAAVAVEAQLVSSSPAPVSPAPVDVTRPQPQPAKARTRDTAPAAPQQTPPVAGETVAAAPAATRRDTARDKAPAILLQPAIDIEALFPGGGDRPLTVTFARDGRPAATAPASLAASPAPLTPPAPPIVLAAQAVAVPLPPPETRRADDGKIVDISSTAPLPFGSAPAVAPSGHVAPASQPASAQQVVLQQHLDLAHDGAWLDSLARDIANSADSDSRLSFRLNPAHLGSLHVELSNGADGTSIRFTAETEAARAILVDSRHHLVAEARAQGVRVAETQIDVAGSGGQGANLGGGQHQQGSSQAHMARSQQNLLTILPQTRPVADAGASSALVRERYA